VQAKEYLTEGIIHRNQKCVSNEAFEVRCSGTSKGTAIKQTAITQTYTQAMQISDRQKEMRLKSTGAPHQKAGVVDQQSRQCGN